MSAPRFLFMGEQEDPGFDVWASRQVGQKLYDATREPTWGESVALKQWKEDRKPSPRPGGGFYPGGEGPCVCGDCFYRLNCGGAS